MLLIRRETFARRIAMVAVAWVAIVCCAEATDLSPMAADQRFFTMSPLDFSRKYGKLGFSWTSAAKTSARLAANGVTVFGAPVVEVVVEFDGNSAKQISLAIYTRGDAGRLAPEDFHRVVETLKSNLSRRSNSKCRQFRKNVSTELESFVWRYQNLVYRLDAMSTVTNRMTKKTVLPEFIKISIFPHDPRKSLGAYGESKRLIDPKEIKARVKTAENGDTWISGIPMIDQGTKGYCACAASARVLSYYGRQVDQHLLAKLSRSSNLGTHPAQLRKALKGLQVKLNFKVRNLVDRDEKDHLVILKYYDREAKKHGLPDGVPRFKRPITDLSSLYAKMNPKCLLAAVARRKTSVNAFRKHIKDNVCAGMPLLWTMFLGVWEEKNASQARGGHMRLIIGYNDETDEVIYSDTWGAGHEHKRMQLLKAFTVTTSLDVIRAY